MLLLLCVMADMSKFPFLATGSCQFGGIAEPVNVMQCCRLFHEHYPENVIYKYIYMYIYIYVYIYIYTTLAIWGLNPSFFMTWEDLDHPIPYVEPPLGQLKLLSRPIDALVKNVSTGTYVLCYHAKLEKMTFNYCNFCIICKAFG